ncbi:hypothetical protein ACCT04_35810, partial [Rhizobium ruizarguesonis]
YISDAITTPFEEANRIVWPEVVPIRAPSASLVVVAVPPLQKIRIASLAMAVALTMPLAVPAREQVVIQEGQGSEFFADPDDSQT